MCEDLGPDPDACLVIDNGSYNIRGGYAGEESPRCTIPAVLGQSTKKDSVQTSSFICDGALEQREKEVLDLSYPIEHGIVRDWDGMEKIWRYVICDKLQADPTERPLLLSEAVYNPKGNRDRMAEMMFESLNVPALYVEMSPVLCLYGAGYTNGLVCSCGDGVMQIMPIYEGFGMMESIERIDLGGRDLTKYLVKLLRDGGKLSEKNVDLETVRQIKEKLGYVAQDFHKEMTFAGEKLGPDEKYTLQDGEEISLGNELFRVAEPLFQPSLLGIDGEGLSGRINKSIMSCDNDLWIEFYKNILLFGGSTLFPGMAERVKKDMMSLKPRGIQEVGVTAVPEKDACEWEGGAVMGALYAMSDLWVTQEEYSENGPEILRQKGPNKE